MIFLSRRSFVRNFALTFVAGAALSIRAGAELSAEQLKTVELIIQKNLEYIGSIPNAISLKYDLVDRSPDFRMSYTAKVSGNRFYLRSELKTGNGGISLLAFDGERYQSQADDYLMVAKNRDKFNGSIVSMWASCPLTIMYLFTHPLNHLDEGYAALAQWASWKELESRVISVENLTAGGKDLVAMKVKMDKGIMGVTFDPVLHYYPVKVEIFDDAGRKAGESEVKKFAYFDYEGRKVMIPSLIVGKTPKDPDGFDMSILDEKSVSFQKIPNEEFFRIPMSAAAHIIDLDLKATLK